MVIPLTIRRAAAVCPPIVDLAQWPGAPDTAIPLCSGPGLLLAILNPAV
jgi:hypothetical protein